MDNNEASNWILSTGMAAGVASAGVVFVNGLNACDFLPFPFKSKTKKEEVTVVTTITKTVFRGEKLLTSHSESKMSDWYEKDEQLEWKLHEKTEKGLNRKMKEKLVKEREEKKEKTKD